MLEFFLMFFKAIPRRSRYPGIGIRGGFVLALLWSLLCGVGGLVGWSVTNTIFVACTGFVVGYRLEGVGGAIAVAVLTALYWSIAAASGWHPAAGAGQYRTIRVRVGRIVRCAGTHCRATAPGCRFLDWFKRKSSFQSPAPQAPQ